MVLIRWRWEILIDLIRDADQGVSGKSTLVGGRRLVINAPSILYALLIGLRTGFEKVASNYLLALIKMEENEQTSTGVPEEVVDELEEDEEDEKEV